MNFRNNSFHNFSVCDIFHQRLAAAQESHPPPLLLSPEESSTPPESAPLYRLERILLIFV